MRTREGEHVLDREVKLRAEKRKADQASEVDLPRNYLEHVAVPKPALDVELARFKAIVRHIARHELEERYADMFIMDDGTKFRRLAKVGIYGHQPGIAAHVKTSEEEEQRIMEGLPAQKAEATPRTSEPTRISFARKRTTAF